ncbi:MAG: T9SS type A sorting domain-containing protein [Ignavibacteriae bacterium]|nr:T9SS type A sorting domain-containing protein [Ignavibacteriota bacterium]
MQKFSLFWKTSLFCLIVFLSLFGLSQNLQAQSWVQEATQGGFIIKKVVSDTAVCTGQPFSYTIYYTIPAGATNVTIIDNLAPGGMFLGASYSSACGTPTVVSPTINQMGGTYSLSWASVPTGCTGSFTITIAFPNGTTCPGTTLRNNVCIMGTLDNKLYEFCTGYVNVTALANNPWHINKYPLGVAWQGGNCPYASASDTITYQICVYKDVGTTCQLNLVSGVVKDTLPAGAVLVSSTCGATQTGNVITWNVGNLNANQMYNTVCCQFKVYYPSSLFPAGTPLLNQAWLSGQLGTPQPSCGSFNFASNQTCVQVGSFTKGTLYKWAYTNRQPGCAGQYVIYVCNNGTTSLPVTVLDTLPITLTGYSLGPQWNLTGSLSSGIVTVTGTLAPGQCGYVYINFTIPANASVGSTITNCAWLTNAAGGPPQQACVSFVVDAPAPTPCLWKDVCNKQASYTPGSVFRYRLRIQNIGGLPLTNVTLTDQLDPNLEYVGNPSYYKDNNWNTPCTTTPANPWTGVIGLAYNSGTNIITATIDTVPSVCQNIFYSNCGMYGTAGVPFYFIEFDVKVRDSSALGSVPNNFKLSGGSLGTATYTSNTDYVLIVGVIGFSLDKGVKKPADPNYGTTVSTTTGSTVDYRLKMNSSGTAQLRYVTFADLLPRDASPSDSKILQLCGPRGTTGNYDVSYNSFISASPSITQWKNPFSTGLANVNNLFPTGAPGNAFTNGCGTGGTWNTNWVSLDKNLGAHFGSTAIGVTGATVEFNANVMSGTVPASGTICNTFAASGWTKHLIQSNIVNYQLAGQSESSPVCITLDTVPTQQHCIDSVKIEVKCIGKDAAGNYQYSIAITASSCFPATLMLNSPDGTFSPTTFSLSSSPWTINPTFTHTSANNPIKIKYAILCNGLVCRDSLMLDLPPCDHQEPEQCCDKFIHKIEKPQIVWTGSGAVIIGVGMSAGPAPIKKFTATIVSAQLRRPSSAWLRIYGDIVAGSLVVAPAPGPQLLSIYSREAVWGEGQCIDWQNGANLILKMIFPPVPLVSKDTLMFAIRYSFTDCNCLTCDTVIYYTIPRKWKYIPWDPTHIHIVRGSADGNEKGDHTQAEAPPLTSIVMDDANNGNLWIISPDNPDNDVTITGVEVNSQQVPLSGIKNGTSDGIIEGNTGFVESDIKKGDEVPISLTFENSAQIMQFPVYVRYAYKMTGFDEILYTEPIVYTARVSGAQADKLGIDADTKPVNVASYALYISNSNGYNEGIASISIKPLGSLKLLAVGPPNSENGTTYLVPQILEDGSYIITVPSQGTAGLESSKTAKPIFLTLSGVDGANAEIEFVTFDNNMQQISQGKLTLSDPISAVDDGNGGGLNFGSILNPVSPNPAKNFVTISFALNETESNAKLSIVDLKGNEVLNVLDNASIGQGSYIRGVDVSNLPSGAYFIVLRTQNGVSTKSLSIVK